MNNNRNFSNRTGWKIAGVILLQVAFATNNCYSYTIQANNGTDDETVLSRKIQTSVEDIVLPSMLSGDDATFYQAYGEILSKADRNVIGRIEEIAASEKLTSPFDYFIGLKIKRIDQGIDFANSKFTVQQATYLIQGFNRRLADFVVRVNEHEFLQDPIVVPDDWQKSRDLFWGAHVINNEFDNNQRLLRYGVTVLNPIEKRIRNSEDKVTKHQIATFEDYLQSLNQLQQKMTERAMEARLIRFERSQRALDKANSFEDNLVQAMNVEMDAETLVPFLEGNQYLQRSALRQADLVTIIREQLTTTRVEHPATMEKAYLFRTGSHWWLRGRYGRGPLANGLLKSPESMRSQAAMNALYMPRKRPSVVAEGNQIGSNRKSETPVYKRRHYYTWALEYRPITSNARWKRESHSLSENIKLTNTARFENETFFY